MKVGELYLTYLKVIFFKLLNHILFFYIIEKIVHLNYWMVIKLLD
jgi:hypothetical protein